MKKHKTAIKKQELLDRLGTMLKEGVLTKKEYVSITLFVQLIFFFSLCRMPK